MAYKNYCRKAKYFQSTGCVLILAGIAAHYLITGSNFGLALAIIGVALLFIGWASMQPHNQVKAFAYQCCRTQEKIMAEGLLEAVECRQKIRLAQRSLLLVQSAIKAYSDSENADSELVHRLQNAAKQHLIKKIL